MEFRILGSVGVNDGGREIPIRAGNDRALLALLLLHANEVVSSERLVDELWGETPPASAAKIVQNTVSNLRRSIGSERLETRDRGYLLHVTDDELDAARFERLVRDRRAHEALELWRGEPLADLDGQPFASDAVRRLEELRLAALEQRFEDDLAAGETPVAELEQLTREHPFHERLHGLLMRALYADGRQTEALEVYRRLRYTLRDQLGLEPGPELQELERAVLQHDPALTVTRKAAVRRRRRPWLLLALGAALAVAAVVAYVATRGSEAIVVTPNSVVVIDPNGNHIESVIRLGTRPGVIAAGPSGVWIASATQDTVTHVDPASGETTAYGVEGPISDLAVDRRGAWVVSGSYGGLTRIDAGTGVGPTRRLPPTPIGGAFAVATRGRLVWVAGNTLVKVSQSGQVLQRSRSTECCAAADIALAGGFVWVVNLSERLLRIGAQSLTVLESSNLSAMHLQLAAGDGTLWAVGNAATLDGNGVSSIWGLDPRTGQATSLERVRGWVDGVAVGAGGVWTSDEDGTIARIDRTTGRVVSTLHLPRRPLGVAAVGDRVWVIVG